MTGCLLVLACLSGVAVGFTNEYRASSGQITSRHVSSPCLSPPPHVGLSLRVAEKAAMVPSNATVLTPAS